MHIPQPLGPSLAHFIHTRRYIRYVQLYYNPRIFTASGQEGDRKVGTVFTVFLRSLTIVVFRLNLQHRIIIRAFENQLAVAPLNLKSGDRVLESGAGSGELRH